MAGPVTALPSYLEGSSTEATYFGYKEAFEAIITCLQVTAGCFPLTL